MNDAGQADFLVNLILPDPPPKLDRSRGPSASNSLGRNCARCADATPLSAALKLP
jgi:hypothetical protein